MLRPIRTLISLVVLAATVWCSFTARLGSRTFAEHMDRIGQTPEARELLDSTRSAVTPLVEKATDRMLGEYIEAPTHAPAPTKAGAALSGEHRARSSGPTPARTSPPRPQPPERP